MGPQRFPWPAAVSLARSGFPALAGSADRTGPDCTSAFQVVSFVMSPRPLLAGLLLVAVGSASGQFLPDPPGEGCSARNRGLARLAASPAAFADPGIDARHYALRLNIVPSSPLLLGQVTMTATAVHDTVTSVIMDLSAPMTVDSVRANGVTRRWNRFPQGFSVELPAPVPGVEPSSSRRIITASRPPQGLEASCSQAPAAPPGSGR